MSPAKGTTQIKPFLKRKPTNKGDRPSKKPKEVVATTVGEKPTLVQLPPPPRHGAGKGLMTAYGPIPEKRPSLLREDPQRTVGLLSSIIKDDDYEFLGNYATETMGETGLFGLALGVLMMKSLMDHCLSHEKWVDHLREKVEATKTELNELKAWKEVQVQKLTLTKKNLEESESHVDELRKMLRDKEGEITTLREQVHRVKVDGKAEFRDSDGFLTERSDCYIDDFNECLC